MWFSKLLSQFLLFAWEINTSLQKMHDLDENRKILAFNLAGKVAWLKHVLIPYQNKHNTEYIIKQMFLFNVVFFWVDHWDLHENYQKYLGKRHLQTFIYVRHNIFVQYFSFKYQWLPNYETT